MEDKQALYDASKCNTPSRDKNVKYFDIQHGLKKDFEPHVDISAAYLWSQDDAKSQSTKIWFDMGIFPFDGRATIYGYLIDKKPCYTLFDTGASKAMLNKKFYDMYINAHFMNACIHTYVFVCIEVYTSINIHID